MIPDDASTGVKGAVDGLAYGDGVDRVLCIHGDYGMAEMIPDDAATRLED